MEKLTSGQVFAAMDRLLDEARRGVFYLRQPAIADMVVECIRYNAGVLEHYALHAFAVMPNHVHLLVTPAVPLPILTKSLKGITAKRANMMLNLTGKTFWQNESYDHLVRNRLEFERIRNYIEQNPVRRGAGKRSQGVSMVQRRGDRGVARRRGRPPHQLVRRTPRSAADALRPTPSSASSFCGRLN